nr:hypothetical protein [Eubacterium sp.]
MKTNKFLNFILEISQVFLVFLGVYSALMCATLSVSLPVNRLISTLVLLGGAFLFYGLFTVLETFRHGKLYGMLGLTAFYVVVFLRFQTVIQKGLVTIVNTYLKEFMNATQTNLTLLSGKGFINEKASVGYCVSLVVILIGVYLIALVSSCFYRKRRSAVYVVATVLFFILPITIGKVGYFSNVVTYIFVSMAIVGTRYLRSDATDKRMRQKLSLVLLTVGLVTGVVTYLYLPPERYNNNMTTIVQTKNTALALTTWSKEDVLTWIRQYFSGDVMDYGKIGKKNKVNRSGQTLLKISGDVDHNHGIYFKGYIGAQYSNNRWRQVKDESGAYENEKKALASDGLSVDNWHVTLRNQIGESQKTGNEKLWTTGKLTVKNLAFGYGNYLVPYYPTTAFSAEGGRTKVTVPGVQYETEYFLALLTELKAGLAANTYRLAGNEYWSGNQKNRLRLQTFVKKYYLDVPEELKAVTEEYQAYLNSQGGLYNRYLQGTASVYEVLEETRNFIMMDTKYTLSPGKTPRKKEAVTYFLQENKKGYSAHYATAAAMLLRSVGIPTRYVEGIYVSKEQLADLTTKTSEIEVTDKELHAWIEVYQENYGFVPVEVTPGRGEEEAEGSSVKEDDMEDTSDKKPNDKKPEDQGGKPEPSLATPTPIPEEDMTFENIESDNYNREDDREETPQVDTPSKEKPEKKEEKTEAIWWKILLAIVGSLLLFVVVMESQRRIRIFIFKRQLRTSKVRRQILMYHRHLEVAFEQKGIRYKGQSVDTYTDEIAESYHVEREIVHVFVSTVFCASFSPNAFSREHIMDFRKAYRDIRRSIYGELSGAKKLYYMYILCI